MSAAITSLTSPTSSTSSPAPSGLNSLNSSDFLKVMIAQLQQQDPLNPSDSNQLLTQLSQIQSLQSSQNLNSTLTGLSLQQSIASGSGMIGKYVQGIDATGAAAKGSVQSIRVANQAVSLELDSGQELPLANVTQVNPTAPVVVAPPVTTPVTTSTTAPATGTSGT